MRCLWMLGLGLGGCVLSGDDIPPPTIASIVPPSATEGTTVTVDGDHFCPVPMGGTDDDPPTCDAAAGLIRFGATTATTTRWTGMEIDAVVPGNLPGDYDVVITIGGRSSNAARFTILP
jgi:hypothetical protein